MRCRLQSCGSLLLVIALFLPAWGGHTQCRVEDRGVQRYEKPAYDLLPRCGGKCNVTYEGRLLHVWADPARDGGIHRVAGSAARRSNRSGWAATTRASPLWPRCPM